MKPPVVCNTIYIHIGETYAYSRKGQPVTALFLPDGSSIVGTKNEPPLNSERSDNEQSQSERISIDYLQLRVTTDLNLNLIAAYDDDDDDDECFPTKTPGFGGKMRAMNILAGNEHFNRRSQLCAFWREKFLAGNGSDRKCAR